MKETTGITMVGVAERAIIIETIREIGVEIREEVDGKVVVGTSKMIIGVDEETLTKDKVAIGVAKVGEVVAVSGTIMVAMVMVIIFEMQYIYI